MTETQTKPRARPLGILHVCERLVRFLALTLMAVGLFYFVRTSPDMDPTLIRAWLITWGVLVVVQIVLSVQKRR